MKNNTLLKYALVMGLIQVSGNPGVEALGQELVIVGYFLIVAFLSLITGIRLSKKAISAGWNLHADSDRPCGSVWWERRRCVYWLLPAIAHSNAADGYDPRFFAVFCPLYVRTCAAKPAFLLSGSAAGLEGVFAPYDLAPGTRGKTVLGIHTFFDTTGRSVPRNSGLMWEPGAFAGYLALALFFCATVGRNLKISAIEVVAIIVALGTTLSTMGYIAFAVVTMAYFLP